MSLIELSWTAKKWDEWKTVFICDCRDFLMNSRRINLSGVTDIWLHQLRISSDHDDGLAKVLIGSPVWLSAKIDVQIFYASSSILKQSGETLQIKSYILLMRKLVRWISTTCRTAHRNNSQHVQRFVKAYLPGNIRSGQERSELAVEKGLSANQRLKKRWAQIKGDGRRNKLGHTGSSGVDEKKQAFSCFTVELGTRSLVKMCIEKKLSYQCNFEVQGKMYTLQAAKNTIV